MSHQHYSGSRILRMENHFEKFEFLKKTIIQRGSQHCIQNPATGQKNLFLPSAFLSFEFHSRLNDRSLEDQIIKALNKSGCPSSPFCYQSTDKNVQVFVACLDGINANQLFDKLQTQRLKSLKKSTPDITDLKNIIQAAFPVLNLTKRLSGVHNFLIETPRISQKIRSKELGL